MMIRIGKKAFSTPLDEGEAYSAACVGGRRVREDARGRCDTDGKHHCDGKRTSALRWLLP